MRSGTFSERRGLGFLRAGRSGARSSWSSWAQSGAAIIEHLDIADDQHHLDTAACRPGRAKYVPVRCPGYVSALYEAAGLRDVAEWNVGVELVAHSPTQYWEMISEHVSLAVAALQLLDEPARERIAKAVIAAVS